MAVKRKTKTKKPAAKKAKTNAKKPAASKAKAKTKAKKPVAAPKPAVKLAPATKKRTKSEVYSLIAASTELTKAKVAEVFETLSLVIEKDLSTKGPKEFTLPGLCKIVAQKKAATKARKGVNPFTGEEIMIKAKPARNVVKVRPLKNLKDMV